MIYINKKKWVINEKWAQVNWKRKQNAKHSNVAGCAVGGSNAEFSFADHVKLQMKQK